MQIDPDGFVALNLLNGVHEHVLNGFFHGNDVFNVELLAIAAHSAAENELEETAELSFVRALS